MKSIQACSITLATGAFLCAASTSQAYTQVYDLATAQAGTSATFLDSVVVDGTTTYNILRSGENVVTKIAHAGTLNTSSVLTADATWGAFSGAFISGQLGADVTGNVIRAVNFFDSSIYQIDLGTGTPSSYVSNAELLTSLGLVAADFNLVATNSLTPSGEVAFYNADSGARLIGITNGPGSASLVLDQAGITALTGGTTLSGGMTVAGNDIYFASNSADSIFKIGTNGAGGATVLSQSDITALTGEASAGFDDILAAPNGQIYFYETTSDSILSFNPADPANTLKWVISEALLLAGPMQGDNVDGLAWFDGKLAWAAASTSGGQLPGFYSIPEPASLALMGLGGLAAIRRTR